MKQKQKELRTQFRNEKRGSYMRGRKKKNDYLKNTWRPEKKKVKKITPKMDYKLKVVKDNIFKRIFKWIYGIFRRKM